MIYILYEYDKYYYNYYILNTYYNKLCIIYVKSFKTFNYDQF